MIDRSRSNLSQRIRNPQPPNGNEAKSESYANSTHNDPESQLPLLSDDKYAKDLTGRSPASLSFLYKRTSTIVREVSHQFDQFIYVLVGFGAIDLFIGFCVLSCMYCISTSSECQDNTQQTNTKRVWHICDYICNDGMHWFLYVLLAYGSVDNEQTTGYHRYANYCRLHQRRIRFLFEDAIQNNCIYCHIHCHWLDDYLSFSWQYV